MTCSLTAQCQSLCCRGPQKRWQPKRTKKEQKFRIIICNIDFKKSFLINNAIVCI